MKNTSKIILTHGTYQPTTDMIDRGEVLVQHTDTPVSSSLHTVTNDGNTLVSFPSKEWVLSEISKINTEEGGSDLTPGNNIGISNGVITAKGYLFNDSGSTPSYSMTTNISPGNQSKAGGNYTFVTGYNCKTTDGDSSANSFCGGDESTVSNQDCFVYGKGLKTNLPHQSIFGKYNTGMPGWDDKPALEVGYGSSDTSRSTIFVCNKNGYCASVYGFGTGTGSDFAEYFEWYDGNPNNDDRIGYMVQLNGDKIELSKTFNDCIGIVTGTEAFISDSASIDWHSRYLKDEYGRIIYETNENNEKEPKLNPNYDNKLVYVPRMYRKEWSPIGLLGKVHVRQDGSLKVGGYADCKNGIATNGTIGYKVLKIINDKVALVLVK